MRYSLAAALVLAAAPAFAQEEERSGFFGRLFGGADSDTSTEEEQGGFLERMIEDNLSGEGRDVVIRGFKGILGGKATLETLTISDNEGVWLTITDATLDWNRAALLRGRLQVNELTAASIELQRLPLPVESDDPPTPEASGFSLPELPVSVNIGQIAAERVDIGEPVFGAETVASLTGSLSLADGEGDAELDINRLNGDGRLVLDAGYANATSILALDLSLEEGPDGIVANLIDLPGRPSLAFSVTGEAPVNAYAADIRLATDGEERLTGRIETAQPEDRAEVSLIFTAGIRGDVAPLFAPDYQAFFGDDVTLNAVVTTFTDGRLAVDDLGLRAAAVDLSGRVLLSAGGLPSEIDLSGQIMDPDGDPVLLPLTGPETRVDRVALNVDFNAAEGDRWNGIFEVLGLSREGFAAETLSLEGTGRIRGGDPASVLADLTFDATQLDLGNEDAEAALGERVTGSVNISWSGSEPVRLSGLSIEGETYSLAGDATVAASEDGLDIAGQAGVRAEDLAVFSGLAGRALGGSVALDSRFDIQPLAGFFDVALRGSTTDLMVSQPEADHILAGEVRLDVAAARDETGIRVNLTTLESPNASVVGQANLKTDASTLSISASLADAAMVLPKVSGPVRLTASADQQGDIWNWRANGGLDGTGVDLAGTAADVFGTPVITASGTITTEDLSDFAEIAGRDIAGALTVRLSGEVVADLSRADIGLDGVATDLMTGVAEADRLLIGSVGFTLDGAMAGEVLSVQQALIKGQNIFLDAKGTVAPDAGRIAASGRVASASLLLDGAPEGPLDFTGEASLDGRDWTFEVRAEGPDLTLAADGVALDPLGPAGAVEGRISVNANDLSIFSELARRPLSGGLSVAVEGGVFFDLSSFGIKGTTTGRGLSIGQTEVDLLLAGDLALSIDASRSNNVIDVNTLTLTTNLLDLRTTGALGLDGSSLKLDGRLADVGAFAAGFPGPATVNGTIGQERTGGDYRVDVNLTGPGGTRGAVAGTAAVDFATVNLAVEGFAPLALANGFIQPRSIAGEVGYNLAINGPLSVNSISGQISTSGARLVTPTLGITLNEITGNVSLNSGRADLNFVALPAAGGRLRLNGPLSLTPPFNADLNALLDEVVLTDGQIYETRIDGQVGVDGPLRGGARIAGDLQLGLTTIRIPSSAIGGSGPIPEVVHINESPPIRATRKRAGLIRNTEASSEDSGPGFPLDVRISAPNQLFVRGRGLESEFAGELRVTGTTKDVAPIGGFSLVRGRLDILGQRLALEEATITMQGSFVPVLRIVATTTSDDFNISVIVAGSAANPDISFVSEPELPEEEVLSRLLFGQGLDTLSALQAARLALAVRTLAGQGGESLVGRVRDRAGLADFNVTTDEEGNTEVQAGIYLTDRVYSDVTVDSAGKTQLNLNLDLTDSVAARVGASNEGETAVGIFFERDY